MFEETRALAKETAEVQQSLPEQQRDLLHWHFWTEGSSTLCALKIGPHQYCPELSFDGKEVTLRTGAAHIALSDSKEVQTMIEVLKDFRAGEKLPVELLGIPIGQ